MWNNEWVVRVQCDGKNTIPTCVTACGDVWQVRYEGAPTACFRCGDPDHQAAHCKALILKREEAVVSKWETSMGMNTEVFFPTRRLKDMTEQDFAEKGFVLKVRNHSDNETSLGNDDESTDEKENVLKELEEKIKSIEEEYKELQEIKFWII